MTNKSIKYILFIFLLSISMQTLTAGITYKTNPTTGAIESLNIDNDSASMNWLVSTDGSQYPWVTNRYGWGLGRFTVTRNHQSSAHWWREPNALSSDGASVTYQDGGIQINVERQSQENGDLVETYRITNVGKEVAAVQDLALFTPFNDNYPDSKTCISQRAHAHIWPGENAAWVNALRMGGNAPHLGLVVTEGSIVGYEVNERGRDKANSQYRGIFALRLPDLWLSPGQSYTLQWRIFSHQGNQDFLSQVIKYCGTYLSADKYVGQVGDTITVVANARVTSYQNLKNVSAKVNGHSIPVKEAFGGYTMKVPVTEIGEMRLDFHYNGKTTHADLLGIPTEQELMDRRISFILERQQMNRPEDTRYGAYMIYDCEGDSIYLNDTPNCNPVDRDEGAERTGMGVLMAKMYRLTGDTAMLHSVENYASFVRNKLQTTDYKTFSSVDQTNRNRGYNYMWVADLYFQLCLATGNKQYAQDGYLTLQSMFNQFGYGFYAIDIPVLSSIEALTKVGMKRELKTLLKDYEKIGDNMIAIGLDYPAHEVNFEQSIVAPAVEFLTQMHLATGDKKYLAEAERQIPVLEAFNGMQPSYHLSDIGIRHWDGHWFGKREMFGDTMPHYWSTITAAAFHYYYQITGDGYFEKKAQNIVHNNLCLFFADGSASCAYLYPDKIDGAQGGFYDPYANDQDWALVYYLRVMKNL